MNIIFYVILIKIIGIDFLHFQIIINHVYIFIGIDF